MLKNIYKHRDMSVNYIYNIINMLLFSTDLLARRLAHLVSLESTQAIINNKPDKHHHNVAKSRGQIRRHIIRMQPVENV